jgi:hypothetical protein
MHALTKQSASSRLALQSGCLLRTMSCGSAKGTHLAASASDALTVLCIMSCC